MSTRCLAARSPSGHKPMFATPATARSRSSGSRSRRISPLATARSTSFVIACFTCDVDAECRSDVPPTIELSIRTLSARRSRLSRTAPVGPRDNFQVMAIGVGEVDTPPAVVVVDLARAVAHRVGPVFKPSLADAVENSVKIRLADQERVVLWADRAFGVGEVERDPVVEFHHVEMAEASRRWPTQHLGQEPSGHRLVGRPDDDVVEVSSHAEDASHAAWRKVVSRALLSAPAHHAR